MHRVCVVTHPLFVGDFTGPFGHVKSVWMGHAQAAEYTPSETVAACSYDILSGIFHARSVIILMYSENPPLSA